MVTRRHLNVLYELKSDKSGMCADEISYYAHIVQKKLMLKTQWTRFFGTGNMKKE